jgi:putative membrane protein
MTTNPDRRFFIFNAIISTAAFAFLIWLTLIQNGVAGIEADLSFVPAVNAGLNALSTLLLLAGFVAIRAERRELHKRLMVSAFFSSAVFLVGYVLYHAVHGDTRYAGEGAMRTLYFVVLATHIPLSMVIVPGALTIFWFAYRGEFERHRRVARVVLPIWLYVSVTGVLIYFMLHG